MQSNYDGSTHRQYKATNSFSSYDPLNPEHKDIVRVPWVKFQNLCKYFTFHSGAQTLESYEIIFASYQDFVIIWGILQGWLQPDISAAT
jgi:hypothetical protein